MCITEKKYFHNKAGTLSAVRPQHALLSAVRFAQVLGLRSSLALALQNFTAKLTCCLHRAHAKACQKS